MFTPTRRLRALPLALTLTGALVCAGLIALPAEAAAPVQQVTAETGKAVSIPSAKVVNKKRSTKVPVWVTLGGGSDVAGAKVRIYNSSGKVVASATTNAGGVAMVKRGDLPSGNFTIRASGGKKLASVGASQLIARASMPANKTRVMFVSPVTTTAYQVASQKGISYGAEVNKVKTSLSMPMWATAGQFSTAPVVFSGREFLAWAKKNGGVTKATGLLAGAASKGTQLANFAVKTGTKMRSKQTRGAATTAVWVGSQLLAGVLKGSASDATTMAIGDVFGQSDPDATALSEINADLYNISNQLTALQESMNDLISLELEGQYDTLAATMATVVGNTSDQWLIYQTATTLDPKSSDYDTTIQEYALDFNTDLSPYMGQFNSLFTTSGGTGVLEALYSENNQPWWVFEDVNNISSTIDYYGTVFAQAVALLNEAWWAPGATQKTSTYINSQNNTLYNPMSNNIYFEMPTQLANMNTIVDPKGQTMYQLQAATVQEVWENTSRGNDENPSCNSKGSPLNASTASWPVVQPSSTNWANLWQGKVSDKSWQVAPSSDFGFLAQSRTSNDGSKQYALDTLKVGAPDGWVMVGSDTQPIGGFQQVQTAYGAEFYEFENFMWCYSTSVSLVASTDQSWVYNVATDTSGHDTYPGTAASQGTPAPVGILIKQQGTFDYRTPTSPVKVS